MSNAKAFLTLGCTVTALLLAGCSNVVHFTTGRPASLDEATEVTTIDGRNMTRAELESVAAEYQFMARWSVRVFGAEDYEDKLQLAIEKAAVKTRELGYRVLFFTGDSETIAAVLQDAHAVGPADHIILYALREK